MTIDGAGGGRGRKARPAAQELARYEALFAARTRGMRSSAMRDMMALTERPEVISLAGGLPDTSTFAPELYAKLMSHVAAESTARALQYGPTEGMKAVMECIVEVMAAENTVVDTGDLIVTTGGQQVIDLVCKTLIDPGDVIVAEAPTYPGAVPTFSAYQAEVVQIEMDSDGMPIDELERTLDRLHAEGRRPKFIYTIPNFQNPGGVTMSLARRRRLVEVARERELLVLEDNPYGLLRYEGEPLPTLYSLDASTAGHGGASDFVIYLGTFSKILSPGLRLGWAVAPRPVLEKLNLGKQGSDLCSSSVTQLFVAQYFKEGDWRAYLDTLRDLYRRRRDTMIEALGEHFGPDASWTHPQGGMFIWATLPSYIDTTDLLARAIESENVAFVPGRAAYLDGRGASSMRLNFAGVQEQNIREGIRRIGKVINEQVGLFGTLTSAPGAGDADLRPTSASSAPGQKAAAGDGQPAERGGAAGSPSQGSRQEGMADVVAFPRRGGEAGAKQLRKDR
ncbi:MAG TPA: PLP-dependent aminotransferase family protein [Solirubrobacteraceae bacterium]|nr:PLP-dependent aminotransferase family protein [Solirubrobacteraceae bacterium]